MRKLTRRGVAAASLRCCTFSLSHEDRIRYDASIRHFRDTIAVMEGQYEEGMKQGMEQANIDMARKMKALGADAAFIAKVTRLAAEQIQRL